MTWTTARQVTAHYANSATASNAHYSCSPRTCHSFDTSRSAWLQEIQRRSRVSHAGSSSSRQNARAMATSVVQQAPPSPTKQPCRWRQMRGPARRLQQLPNTTFVRKVGAWRVLASLPEQRSTRLDELLKVVEHGPGLVPGTLSAGWRPCWRAAGRRAWPNLHYEGYSGKEIPQVSRRKGSTRTTRSSISFVTQCSGNHALRRSRRRSSPWHLPAP